MAKLIQFAIIAMLHCIELRADGIVVQEAPDPTFSMPTTNDLLNENVWMELANSSLVFHPQELAYRTSTVSCMAVEITLTCDIIEQTYLDSMYWKKLPQWQRDMLEPELVEMVENCNNEIRELVKMHLERRPIVNHIRQDTIKLQAHSQMEHADVSATAESGLIDGVHENPNMREKRAAFLGPLIYAGSALLKVGKVVKGSGAFNALWKGAQIAGMAGMGVETYLQHKKLTKTQEQLARLTKKQNVQGQTIKMLAVASVKNNELISHNTNFTSQNRNEIVNNENKAAMKEAFTKFIALATTGMQSLSSQNTLHNAICPSVCVRETARRMRNIFNGDTYYDQVPGALAQLATAHLSNFNADTCTLSINVCAPNVHSTDDIWITGHITHAGAFTNDRKCFAKPHVFPTVGFPMSAIKLKDVVFPQHCRKVGNAESCTDFATRMPPSDTMCSPRMPAEFAKCPMDQVKCLASNEPFIHVTASGDSYIIATTCDSYRLINRTEVLQQTVHQIDAPAVFQLHMPDGFIAEICHGLHRRHLPHLGQGTPLPRHRFIIKKWNVSTYDLESAQKYIAEAVASVKVARQTQMDIEQQIEQINAETEAPAEYDTTWVWCLSISIGIIVIFCIGSISFMKFYCCVPRSIESSFEMVDM